MQNTSSKYFWFRCWSTQDVWQYNIDEEFVPLHDHFQIHFIIWYSFNVDTSCGPTNKITIRALHSDVPGLDNNKYALASIGESRTLSWFCFKNGIFFGSASRMLKGHLISITSKLQQSHETYPSGDAPRWGATGFTNRPAISIWNEVGLSWTCRL